MNVALRDKKNVSFNQGITLIHEHMLRTQGTTHILPRDGDWSVFPCGMPPFVTPRGTPPTPHPNAYASYIEIAPAQNLYNTFINVTFSNSPLPLPPQLGHPDTCYVLYNAASKYCTMLCYDAALSSYAFPHFFGSKPLRA